jgi:hypothetical protein
MTRPEPVLPYEEIGRRLFALEAAHPRHVRVWSAGTSVEGEPIRVVSVGAAGGGAGAAGGGAGAAGGGAGAAGGGADAPGGGAGAAGGGAGAPGGGADAPGPDGGRPVMVIATLHAMEHVGACAALALAERAARQRAGTGGAHAAPRGPAGPWANRGLVVVPVANPDGFRAVERALATGRRRFLRTNSRGVDLNRNFGTFWDDRYYLNRLLAPLFSPGSGALSEPETRALDDVASVVRPGHVVSLHAFGEWIFLPYAGSRTRPRDLPLLREIGEGMAAAMPRRRYRVGQLAERSRWFQARGAEIDHFYARHGALSFLIEIGAGPSLSRGLSWPYRWYTPQRARLEADVDNVLPALDYLAGAPGAGAGPSGAGAGSGSSGDGAPWQRDR